MTKRERLVVGGILVVALGLRVAWCLYAARPPGPGLHDPNFYRHLGEQLARFEGYRLHGTDGGVTAYYPPGYSFSLAPFFWLVYHTPIPDDVETGVIATLNIAWQLATIVLAFLVARRLTGRSAAGYVSAGVLALWPNLIFHTAPALSESFFLFLLLVVALLVVSAPWGQVGTRRLVAIGVVLGAATLVRPITIPIYPALLVVLLVSKIGWRRAITQTAVVVGASVAVLAPWVIRNTIVMHQVALSTNTGDNLCMSRRVGGTGAFEFPNDRCFSGPFEQLKRPEYETERDAHTRQLAFEFVREHPGEELRLVFRRLGETFKDDADGIAAVESYGTDVFMSDDTRDLLKRVATGYGALAGVAGVAGLVIVARRRTPEGWFVVLTGVGLLLPPLVFFGDPRFHVPAVPIAAIGVGVLVTAVGYRRSTSLST